MPGIQIENGSYVMQKCVNCDAIEWETSDDYGPSYPYCSNLSETANDGARNFPFIDAPGCFAISPLIEAIWDQEYEDPIFPGDPEWPEALANYKPEIFR